MPQTLTHEWREDLGEWEDTHSTWLHTPGNLTLSGYNPELQNKPFHRKREDYLKSNIGLTRRVASSDRWTAAEIEARGRELTAQAQEIGSGRLSPPRHRR